jgi:hypothetical protein
MNTSVLDFASDVKVPDVDVTSSLCTGSLPVVLELNDTGIVLLDNGFTSYLLQDRVLVN